MQDQLDPQVVNLAKAIRQSESGGNFNAKGKSGEHGAYQFTPDTWNAESSKYGINVPLEQSTPEQQNAVAYNKIKEWKDSGKDVTQIASMWNAGEGEPDAYKGTFSNGKPSVGVNKFGANFNVPKYAESVANTYLSLKNGEQVGVDINNPSSVSTPQFPLQSSSNTSQNVANNTEKNTQDDSLGSQLSGRVSDAGSALNDLASNISGGKGTEHWWSDILHIGGAVGGGIGDLINKGLELIPGVKQGEKALGDEVYKLADTQVGKSVLSSLQSFQQSHPELSHDIGDVFNIVTAIPILRGLGVAADVGKSALASSLKEAVLKGVQKDFEEFIGKSVSKDVMKTMIDNGIIPSVEESGVGNAKKSLIYNTKDALTKLQSVIQNIPKNQITDITDILKEIEGEKWTPGKIVSAIHTGAKYAGATLGEAVAPGITGGALGATGGYLADKGIQSATKGIVKKSLESGGKKIIYPSVKKVLTRTGGLVGSALSQKAINK